MTKEGFLAWHSKFVAEQQAAEQAAEDEKVRTMTAKEREEYRRYKTKPTGRELFTKGVALDTTDEVDGEAQEIDWSLYDRAARDREREAWQQEQEMADSMQRLDAGPIDD